jgi:hypothetical protein
MHPPLIEIFFASINTMESFKQLKEDLIYALELAKEHEKYSPHPEEKDLSNAISRALAFIFAGGQENTNILALINKLNQKMDQLAAKMDRLETVCKLAIKNSGLDL